MSGREQQYEQIEQYLNGALSGEALTAFEAQLQHDTVLQKEVELHKELQQFLADEKAMQLRMALTNADRATKTGKVVFFNKKILAVAASIAAIIMVSYFLLTGGSSTSPEKLFAQHFEPYNMVLNSRGADTQYAATSLYQQGLFEKAIPYWTSLVQKDSANVTAIFYRGICYLGIKEPVKARQDFETVMQTGNMLLSQQVQWYTGLTYLQEGDESAACVYFTTIKEQDFKHVEIQKILESICKN